MDDVQSMDFNSNKTMDKDEFLRLMRLGLLSSPPYVGGWMAPCWCLRNLRTWSGVFGAEKTAWWCLGGLLGAADIDWRL